MWVVIIPVEGKVETCFSRAQTKKNRITTPFLILLTSLSLSQFLQILQKGKAPALVAITTALDLLSGCSPSPPQMQPSSEPVLPLSGTTALLLGLLLEIFLPRM
jgi:hypothetical protein